MTEARDISNLRPGRVTMLDPMGWRVIGEKEVMEKFGVQPSRVVDVQALAGDPVDNVPGVPGIGVKTAAKLINEYGDLENLLARADEVRGKVGQRLRDNADAAIMSKRLVTLRDDVPDLPSMESILATRFVFQTVSINNIVHAISPPSKAVAKPASSQGRVISDPQPGLFEIRMIKGGVGVAARLWRPCQCTVNGPRAHAWQETCDRYPHLIAEVNGVEKPRESAVWWVWLSGRTIDRKMFDYLLADAAWCQRHAPDEPRAKPWRAVEINRTAPAI